MKKVKLMLLSLSILAVVGGALAFTVKSGDQFCTAPAAINSNCPSLNCPDLAQTAPAEQEDDYLCTTTSFNGGCRPGGISLKCGGTPIHNTIE